MAWLTVDKLGDEEIFNGEPTRGNFSWVGQFNEDGVILPKGTIEKLIGRTLTWEDAPVKII